MDYLRDPIGKLGEKPGLPVVPPLDAKERENDAPMACEICKKRNR